MPMRLFAALSLSVLLSLAGPALAAEADDAAAAIRTFNSKMVEVMKDGPKLGFKGRAQKYRVITSDAYDMPAITRAMLGAASAGKLNAEELARLSDSYAAFSAATYSAQFDEWDGEKFEVDGTRAATGGGIIVEGRIAPKTGEATRIDYLVRQDQGGWRIIDVLFDGTVSQVAVRRSEFGSIFRAKGFAGLIEAIEKQTAALEKK